MKLKIRLQSPHGCNIDSSLTYVLHAQVESLERRAGLASEYELERRKQEVLSQLSEQYASIGPQLKDMGLYITELKRYLQVQCSNSRDIILSHCTCCTVVPTKLVMHSELRSYHYAC